MWPRDFLISASIWVKERKGRERRRGKKRTRRVKKKKKKERKRGGSLPQLDAAD